MPTYTTVPDKATGDVLTEANWDTHIKDNINGLIVRAMCRCKNSGVQSVGSGALTALTFDQEDFDTDTMHSTSSNTSRIVATTAGVYLFVGFASFAADADGYRSLVWRYTPGLAAKEAVTAAVSSASSGTAIQVTMLYSMGAGDYMELCCEHLAGNNLDVAAIAQAVWLGKTS